MTEKEFINELKKINIDVSSEKLDKLKILLEELKEYNKKTNLTRIIESNDVYLKHYFDSLTIAKVINLNKYKSLIDVGTGAGFPGLVLAIFYPNLKVTVLDSNIKKIEWLNSSMKRSCSSIRQEAVIKQLKCPSSRRESLAVSMVES